MDTSWQDDWLAETCTLLTDMHTLQRCGPKHAYAVCGSKVMPLQQMMLAMVQAGVWGA